MPFPPCCLISPHLAGSKIPAQNRSRSCRNGFQTTARTTGVYGTNGFCAVNHVQKIIGLERKQLKTTGNRQKKFHRAVHTQEVTGSSPVVSTIKKAAPDGCGLFYGIRGNLKCSAEVNSASAKVLPAAKRLYGPNAPPCHTAPVSFVSTRHPSPWNRKIPGGFCSRHTPRSPSHTGEGNSLSSGRTGRNAFPPRLQGTLQLCKVRCFGRFYR